MKKIRALLALFLCLMILTAPALAAAEPAASAPEDASQTAAEPSSEAVSAAPEYHANAKAALLIDLNTGRTIYEQDADEQVYPASLTKIMTCLLALENGNLSDTVTITENAYADLVSGSSTADLQVGEQLRLEDLLYCMMVESGNEAANAVAEHIGGTIEDFVKMMNERAYELGCTHTHFMNPHGLHNESHYTTARDMALIAREAMQDETFRKIASTTTYALPRTNMHGSRRLDSKMAELFGSDSAVYPAANGIKTGYTSKAGYCFVGSATKNGVTFISVVFNCGSYAKCWSDTKKLMEYGFTQYVSTSVAELYAMSPKVLEISKYDLNDPQLGKLELSLNKLSDSTNDTIVTLQSRLDYLSSNFNDLVAIEYVHDPVAPITAGEVMATLTYYPEEGEPIEYELVASRSVSRRVLDFPSLDELIADTLNDPNPFPRFTVEIFLFLVAVVAVIWGVVKGVKRLMGFRSKKPRRKAVKPISRYYR